MKINQTHQLKSVFPLLSTTYKNNILSKSIRKHVFLMVVADFKLLISFFQILIPLFHEIFAMHYMNNKKNSNLPIKFELSFQQKIKLKRDVD